MSTTDHEVCVHREWCTDATENKVADQEMEVDIETNVDSRSQF